MKIIHTADWHIGNMLHGYSRTYEFQRFLEFVVETCKKQDPDALIISGDIYDSANPSSESLALFGSFIGMMHDSCPETTVIATSGNHDSQAKLHALYALLGRFAPYHVVGKLPVASKDDAIDGKVLSPEDELLKSLGRSRTGASSVDDKIGPKPGEIDFESMIFPIKDRKTGEIGAYVAAVPFIRSGNFPPSFMPNVNSEADPYAAKVKGVYEECLKRIKAAAGSDGTKCIAMGHTYVTSGEVSELSEMRIMCGNLGAMQKDIFDGFDYVALGHLHKPQNIGSNIFYSGAPLPFDFGEINYKSRLLMLEFEKGMPIIPQEIPVPRYVDLVEIPAEHLPFAEVMEELQNLPAAKIELPSDQQPLLKVNVLRTEFIANLKESISSAIQGKGFRLACIDSKELASEPGEKTIENAEVNIEKLTEYDAFEMAYREKYKSAPPENWKKAYEEIVDNCRAEEAEK